MQHHNILGKYNDPVLIGGVGGSGSRLIAQLVNKLGFFIGHDLNLSNDNLWFTLLFKRIEILSSSKAEFDELVDIFFYGMAGLNKFTKKQVLSWMTNGGGRSQIRMS